MIDAEKCRKCGLDFWVAQSDDPEIAFEIEEHSCHSCAYLEQHQDKKSDKDAKKFGVTEFPKPVHTDSELVGIDPAKVPKIDWKYRYKFFHGELPN